MAFSRRGSSSEYLRTIAIMAAVTAGCFALRPHLTTVDVAMLLLLGVVAVATRYGRGPSLVASLLSIGTFNFLFVQPYYTFRVHDTAYLLTFAVMLVVALTMSRLTGLIREYALESEARERRGSALAALNAELTRASRSDEVLESLARHAGLILPGRVCGLMAEELDRDPSEWKPAVRELVGSPTALLVARSVQGNGRSAGPGTGHYDDSDLLLVPLRTGGRSLGLVALCPEPPERVPTAEAITTIQELADHAALAIERTRLAERHEQARAEAEAERLRTSLLSSLSHDLRTPLATIEGAASSLLDDPALPPEVRRELAETILEESRRMTRLVSNLLNMIRVETGALAVRKSWQPLEEALGVALLRMDERLRDRTVTVDLPPDLPLVPIDELLIEQVFINLLENAARYTPPGSAIAVTASRGDNEVCVQLADHGPGIPPGEEEAVFRKFYRSPGTTRGAPPGGAGLGLTISRGIVTAHGGRIWVEPRPGGGGAAFRFTLPLSGPQVPELAAVEEAAEADE